MRERRDRKLNPYKYLKQEAIVSDNEDVDIKPKKTKKPPLLRYESENVKMKDCESESETEYEYEQKTDKYEEDDFQGSISCSYWTPAHIRLPYKMVIKQVTLGGNHMVVLDDLGQVWSSGTFMNDGPIGHHFDSYTNEIIRYQRTLRKLGNIESQDDGLQSSRIGKNKQLPQISMIASGVNHFLMLDIKGSIWKMGVTKLGQRWCSRNTKKYLCPQRVSVINAAKNKRCTKKVKFIKIACGNHHNLAISSSNQLYSWGQNIWLQCGHRSDQCGYGDVVDQPRWVPFYKNKKDLDDDDEEDKQIDYKIIDVVAGEHMTVCLATNGSVWTCGRNACGALGRKTKSEGMRDYGSQRVKTEVKPDVMRKVKDLEHISIDWIGTGSVVWFAHNRKHGAVYAFGDSSSGRAGIGCWKSSRGRPVFDEYNLDTNKYEVVSANGGSDHVIFTVRRKRRKFRATRRSNLNQQNDTGNQAQRTKNI